MSIFVGNVSKNINEYKLRDLFEKYGLCKVDLRVR